MEKYFEYGKKLLSVPIQKIIFMDQNYFDMFKIFQNEYTTIIPFKNKNMYFYNSEYFNEITKFNINSTCPEKDTLEYMFTICYKSEFIKDAIENYTKYYKKRYKSEQFIWIYFGINHVMKCSDTEFQQKIINMCFKNYDNIRIASIWDVNCNYSIDIYKDISWYFAGGIFGGNSTYLLKFADLVKENCIKIIKECNTLMWEVNIYFLVYRENQELFSLYKSDHNNSIIDNY